MMSTSDKEGHCDVSPRGDVPGFVLTLDEKRLIIPERPGNKRADSMLNILSNPHVGLVFLIPGLGETLRINGTACLVQEEELLNKMAVNGKTPLLGIGVEVEECYIHCAKAFRRSGLWNPESWDAKESLPAVAKILVDHAKLKNVSSESMAERLEEGYTKRLY